MSESSETKPRVRLEGPEGDVLYFDETFLASLHPCGRIDYSSYGIAKLNAALNQPPAVGLTDDRLKLACSLLESAWTMLDYHAGTKAKATMSAINDFLDDQKERDAAAKAAVCVSVLDPNELEVVRYWRRNVDKHPSTYDIDWDTNGRVFWGVLNRLVAEAEAALDAT